MRWTEHVIYDKKENNVYRALVGKSECKGTLARLWHSWGDAQIWFKIFTSNRLLQIQS
jgi:hypothetical protein